MSVDVNKKLTGILVPAFALRAEEDLGVGDTQAVKDAIDFCHQLQLSVLQLLPINETGGDNSPYNVISSMALDPIYIHLSRLAPEVVPGLKDEHWQQLPENIEALKIGPIDYPKVKSIKNTLLQKAFAQFQLGLVSADLQKEFDDFQTLNKNWLPDYTIFRTIVARKQGNAQWTAWEEALKNIDSARLLLLNDQQFQKDCRFYAYVQWIAHRQWTQVKAYAEKHNIQLIGDIPFGVSRYSADVWANRSLFDLKWSGGAPPEKFFKANKFIAQWGQNWGIPLYNWQAHEQQNFNWWRCRVNQVTKYFHGFRLDHVLGFFRIYAFPWLPEEDASFADLTLEQAAEKTGGHLPKFVPDGDEKAESAKHNCESGEKRLKTILEAAGEAMVIAEDLGAVPDYVRPALQKLGIPGIAIPIFERNEKDRSLLPKEELPALSLATYGTHDNEPLASYYEGLVKWWQGENGHEGWLEVQRLMQFLGLNENTPPMSFTDELLYACWQALLCSPCWLTVLMVTDLLASKQRFNLPGTSDAANWSERLDKSLAQYAQESQYVERFNYLRKLIIENKRQPDFMNNANFHQLNHQLELI